MRGGGTHRIRYIDALKGFAALCVVLGHVVDGYLDGNMYPEANHILFCVYNVIYAFHMALFMTISGKVYAVAYLDNQGKPDRRRLYRQIGNIIVVYVLFSVAFGIVKVVFSGYINKPVSFADIWMIWCKPISPYLYDLVLLYLLFVLPVFYRGNRYLMTGLLIALAFLSSWVSFSWFQIASVLYFGLFFYMGYSDKVHPKWLIGNKWVTLCAAAVSMVLCIFFWPSDVGTLNAVPIANVLIAGGLSLVFWYLFQNIRFFSENRFLRLIGRHSLEIYVLHCFFTAGFRAVFRALGVHDPFVSVLLNFVLSTAISLTCAYICKWIGIHELFFKPVSFAMKFRKSNQGK